MPTIRVHERTCGSPGALKNLVMNNLIRLSGGFLVAAVVAVSVGAVAAPDKSEATDEITRSGTLAPTAVPENGAIADLVNWKSGRSNEQSNRRQGKSGRISASLDVSLSTPSGINTPTSAYDEGITPDEGSGGVPGSDTATTTEASSTSSSAPTASENTSSTSTTSLSASSTSTTSLSASSTSTLRPVDDGSYDAVVRPGESIQAVVDGLPAGSKVLIGSGVHIRQQVRPKRGMTFVGEKGAVLDGEGSTNYAFLAWAESGATDVTIRGLEIRNYRPSSASHGAIHSRVTGWVIEDCDVHDNAYAGVYVSGESIVRNCYIHHNGKIGLKVGGGSRNTLIENNEISHNNLNDAFDPLWEAGGMKIGDSSDLVIRGNNVHDNHGPGIWVDVHAVGVVIENNLVENNQTNGIDYEISSYGVIRNNTVRNNGHGHPSLGWMWGAGITIRSPNVEVYGNIVENNYNGIMLIQTDRGSQYNLNNISVHDNVIINSGLNGGARSAGPSDIFDTSQFDGNEYRYDDTAAKWWRWDDSRMAWDEWVAGGNDPSGVFKKT